MSQLLEFEERGWYLLVRLPSDTSIERMCANAVSIAKECDARGFTKVLLDSLAITKVPSVTDLYEVGARCGDLLVDHLKVAAVVSASATYPDRFFENVLQNRGIAYRWFLDEEQATQWLAKDDDR